ncbi:MAG: hypothetical protein WEE89_15955 [Gemmatimonadota bacterium]
MKRRTGRLPDLGGAPGLADLRVPELPPPPRDAIARTDPARMGLPRGCPETVEYARTEALRFLDKERNLDGNLRGVGLGLREVNGEPTDEFALTFLAYEKRPPDKVPKGCLLPRFVTRGNQKIRVDVIEAPGEIQWTQTPCPQGSFDLSSCSGAAIATEADGDWDGTLGGTWRRLDGSGHRGLTNCHVAIGDLSFQQFIAGLPGTIARLFESPRGKRIFTGVPGAQNFQIMEIDTIWPILAPWLLPIPIAGALPFVFLDCAAGDIDHRAVGNPLFLPPPPPPARNVRGGIITGARIRSAQAPIPGTEVYKVGAQTGTTFGRIRIAFLQIPIAIGPLIVIFDQVLARLAIANGDSGSSMIERTDNHYIGSCWGGLPLNGPPVDLGGGNLMLDHALATPAHQTFWRMNLDLY